MIVILDTKTIDNFENIIQKDGVSLFCPQNAEGLNEGIARHADLQYHYISETKTLYHVNGNVIPKNLDKEIKIVEGSIRLTSKYPGDVICNVARCGEYAIGNKMATDPVLLDLLSQAGVKFIDVSQGYGACSCLCVNDTKRCGIITADVKIYKETRKLGIDALLIPPQKNILLPGYNYGFIGGIYGFFENVLYLTGSLEYLDSYFEIKSFLSGFDIKIVEISTKPPIDIGGIIFI